MFRSVAIRTAAAVRTSATARYPAITSSSVFRAAQIRFNSTDSDKPAVKPNIKLVAEIRKAIEGVSMLKAKEALIKTDNNLEKALEWILEDEAKTGMKKAEKLKGRQALEGLVGVVVGEASPQGNRGAIVELNCETDFVSRNDLFKNLVTQIASTVLLVADGTAKPAANAKGLVHEVPVTDLLQAPLMPDPASTEAPEYTTVQEAITKLIAKLGENISLRRCAVVQLPARQRGLILTGGATHGGDKHAYAGKVGALSVLNLVSKENASKIIIPSEAATTLSRQLTRHLIASPSEVIYQDDINVPLEVSNGGHAPPEQVDAWLDERVLMRQPFIFGGGKVEQIINKLGKEENLRIKVTDAVRWERGEGMVKAEAPDFAEEVRRQMESK
ncbi:Elongation factor Ts, mitochondrial [Actinomortierella ambigua]|nr:Elongation factor Ts, mitochondrial [Actinomortierella ambigua]